MKKVFLKKISWINIHNSLLSVLIALSTLLTINVFANVLDENTIQVGRFSMMELDGWKNKSFEGKTKYSIKNDNNTSYLEAKSMHSASALYKKIKINIHETPYLNWSWRVDKALQSLNEKEKSGDDYAARIYVVFKTGFTPLSARALNYVWSSNNDANTSWPNAFTEKAIMIPLRTNKDGINIWKHEKVNVKQDLLQHFNKSQKYIDGIAIMTDTDNSKGSAIAHYGDIYFSKN